MARPREKRQLEEQVMRQRQKVGQLERRVEADRQRLANSEQQLADARQKERELIDKSNRLR